MQISKKLVKIQSVIDKLEAKGFVVALQHIFTPYNWHNACTVFVIAHAALDLSVHGEARKAPGDNYDKALGTQIAFSRAIRKLSEELGPGELRKILN